MRRVVWLLVLMLLVLHQDVWFWDDRTLVLGVMPIGLAYHTLFSIASTLVWLLAVKFAWPTDVQIWADAVEEQDAS